MAIPLASFGYQLGLSLCEARRQTPLSLGYPSTQRGHVDARPPPPQSTAAVYSGLLAEDITSPLLPKVPRPPLFAASSPLYGFSCAAHAVVARRQRSLTPDPTPPQSTAALLVSRRGCPQAAILAIGSTQLKAVSDGKGGEIRHVLRLPLSTTSRGIAQ